LSALLSNPKSSLEELIMFSYGSEKLWPKSLPLLIEYINKSKTLKSITPQYWGLNLAEHIVLILDAINTNKNSVVEIVDLQNKERNKSTDCVLSQEAIMKLIHTLYLKPIKVLDLSWLYLNDNDLALILAILQTPSSKSFHSILELKIYVNNLGEESTKFLARLIVFCKSLRKLDLTMTQLTDSGLAMILSAVNESKLPTIDSSIPTTYSKFITSDEAKGKTNVKEFEHIKKVSNITELSLQYNSIGDMSFPVLKQLFRHNSVIQKIEFYLSPTNKFYNQLAELINEWKANPTTQICEFHAGYSSQNFFPDLGDKKSKEIFYTTFCEFMESNKTLTRVCFFPNLIECSRTPTDVTRKVLSQEFVTSIYQRNQYMKTK
ncbi:MAG TPA: hypothetical protein VN704_11675, partial [Verrucomicrobiae bacterium]|nr:hypothetical protein [Verrucomicrobiae bacterium]